VIRWRNPAKGNEMVRVFRSLVVVFAGTLIVAPWLPTKETAGMQLLATFITQLGFFLMGIMFLPNESGKGE